MVEILSRLFHESGADEIGKLCYLLQGRVAPLYEPIEFGVGDKMMIRAIAMGTDLMDAQVLNVFKETGDLGTAVAAMKNEKLKMKNYRSKLKIAEVYERLLHIAKATGTGSQEKKMSILAQLVKEADPQSAKYIVRMTLGKLRLGFSDMTILEGLSWMLGGDKSNKDAIEAAYNVRPDLGYIARTVKMHGMGGLSHVLPAVGTPILMARANRLTSAEEIIEKIGNCAVEYKYDGLRLQVHYQKGVRGQGSVIRMFSRNLEDITAMFPDIAQAIAKQIHADEVIFEGEVVAYNPQTGVFVPFQETMQRKRKYNIAEKVAEIPVKLFAFELLYCDGETFINQPYEARKKKLKDVIKKGNTIVYAREIVATNSQNVEDMFEDSVRLHFEGIIAKRLDGVYEAGARSWNWIKYKKAMDSKLADTVDVLVMGYTLGEGKRTIFGVGQFLTGVYDKKKDRFVTLTKVGTGLTDEQFREFFSRVKKLHAKEKPPLYDVDKLLTPDVWVEPELVVEIGGDEITRSAVHTAGRVMEPSKSGKAFSVKTPGYALRFPKLVRFRSDRRPEDATTETEIEKLYKMQGN